jgi:hypothetical protein
LSSFWTWTTPSTVIVFSSASFIRRPPFQGVVKRTLDGSQPDWNSIAPTPAPEGAPNVLLVLTDDAGFGNPSGFGGPIVGLPPVWCNCRCRALSSTSRPRSNTR